MMKWLQSGTLSTGLAMFSMFFGAGNIVFPLAVGQYAKDASLYAIIGLLISAVAVPFLGVITMTLFQGNYRNFFSRIGKMPGFIITVLIMALIGPFGAIPRCVILAYSTLQLFFPDLWLVAYSAGACLLIFLLTYSQQRLLEILGYLLTPLLIGSLFFIVVKGLWTAPSAPPAIHEPLNVFFAGLIEGYNTMDLLGAFFFSSVIFLCLEKELPKAEASNPRHLISLTLKASCIGAGLLGIIYTGFSLLSSYYAQVLADTPTEVLLGTIAIEILGTSAGVVVCTAVVLACLTTAIALAAVFAEFLHQDVFDDRMGYRPCLVITLLITFCMSLLRFEGISQALQPVLTILYPALIILTLLNLCHKLWGWRAVKVPFFITLLCSTLIYLY